MFLPDPGSGFFPSPTPDPGVKKAPDLGSTTLIFLTEFVFWTVRRQRVLHKVPVFQSEENLDDLQNMFSTFYVGDYKYTTKKSKVREYRILRKNSFFYFRENARSLIFGIIPVRAMMCFAHIYCFLVSLATKEEFLVYFLLMFWVEFVDN
jgi:hypothetical protein